MPAPLRRPAVAAVVLAAVLLALLAVRYAGGTSPRWFDVHADAAAGAALGGQGRVWQTLLRLGGPLQIAVVAVALAVLALVLRRRRLALVAIAGPGLTGLATSALKPLVGRLLRGDLAFPSGQTGGATAFGLVAALLLISVLRVGRTGAALILAGGAVLAGGAMALALVVREWHYPTDTIGGFCTAVVVVLGAALLSDGAARWRAGRPRS